MVRVRVVKMNKSYIEVKTGKGAEIGGTDFNQNPDFRRLTSDFRNSDRFPGLFYGEKGRGVKRDISLIVMVSLLRKSGFFLFMQEKLLALDRAFH